MAGLKESFNKYCPPNLDIAREDWIRDPFLVRDLPAHLDHKEKGELIDLVIDTLLQNTFLKEEHADFWLRRTATHPLLSDRALKFIMSFITSHLCEQLINLCDQIVLTYFSSMLYVKNKYTSTLKDLDCV